MIETVSVYTTTLLLMIIPVVLCNPRTDRRILGLPAPMLISLMAYTLMCACRYDVGIDYYSYLQVYKGFHNRPLEFGYKYISDLYSSNQFHFSWLFGTIAIIQMYFLLQAFKNQKRLLIFLLFAFFAGQFFSWMNIMRQTMALAIFICAIQYITQKDWLKYYLLTLLAISFHTSALLLIPLYPIFVFNWHKMELNRVILLLGAVISYFLGSTDFLYNLIFVKLLPYVEALGYENYAGFDNLAYSGSGIGNIVALILCSVVIMYSNKMKTFFNNNSYSIYFTLYYIGYIASNMIGKMIALARPNAS